MNTNRKKIIILGASGMLGHQLFYQAIEQDIFNVFGTVRDENSKGKLNEIYHARLFDCDVLNKNELHHLLSREKPEIIVNCVGVVKQILEDPEETILINSLVPYWLAEIADEFQGQVIQISTDCVFSGRKGDYTEGDIPDPVDLYGKSKLLGELTQPPHLTLRTSFIGHELTSRHGLLEWFLSEKGQINGFANAIWSGLTSSALAKIILQIASQGELSGVFNLSGEPINKYDLLLMLQTAFGKNDINLVPSENPKIDRSLNNSKIVEAGIEIPTLEKMINDMVEGK